MTAGLDGLSWRAVHIMHMERSVWDAVAAHQVSYCIGGGAAGELVCMRCTLGPERMTVWWGGGLVGPEGVMVGSALEGLPCGRVGAQCRMCTVNCQRMMQLQRIRSSTALEGAVGT